MTQSIVSQSVEEAEKSFSPEAVYYLQMVKDFTVGGIIDDITLVLPVIYYPIRDFRVSSTVSV